MPRRARSALTGVVFGVIAMAVIWYAAHDVPILRRLDANVLTGFEDLRGARIDHVASAIASLCNPMPYVLLAAIPVAIALLRGRPRVAGTLLLVLLCANETTEVLKPLLAGPHDPVSPVTPGTVSWPSGHATAAMSLALTMVIAVPSRLRPLVAGVMAAFAVAICWSFLLLGWHYPSDVLGGFLVAGTWTLLGVAAIELLEVRRPERTTQAPAVSLRAALLPPAVIVVLGAAVGGVVALARPHAAVSFAAGHELFVLGALAIAAASFALASALNLMMRRPSP